MSKLKIKLPAEVRTLPLQDKQQIVKSLSQTLGIPEPPAVKPQGGRSMWDPSDDPLIAKLEDNFYVELDAVAQEVIAETIVLLGLPIDDIQKSVNGKNAIVEWVKKLRDKRGLFKKVIDRLKDSFAVIRKTDDIIRSKYKALDKLAEKYIVRSALLGRLRIEAEKANLVLTASIISKLPDTIKAAKKAPFPFEIWDGEGDGQEEFISLSPLEISSMEHSVLQAAEKIKQISDNHRAGIKQLIIQSQKERWGANKLSQALFDVYGDQNRDWRRVAITELAMSTNDAFLAGCEEGDIVQVATVPGACKHCQRLLEGRTFIVSKEPGNGDTHVWPGKSNIGRLVTNWWACCPLHPHCRHRWFRVPESRIRKEVSKP
ncbi:hypothetical protein MF625_001018 [Paenibacillus polymyxa]|uniref:hypothetical protein n=1 Tax=Paenibacillus polymyxa TaxID=1406 RepID=UPI002023CA3E|nr:hypothetical protein [Paenibacillus polymyxa]URJ36599.1 hypothetical protein MF625_001018 [Paenibacillus polymyxa]